MATALDRCLLRAHGQEVFSILGLTALSQQAWSQHHPLTQNTQEHWLCSRGNKHRQSIQWETQTYCFSKDPHKPTRIEEREPRPHPQKNYFWATRGLKTPRSCYLVIKTKKVQIHAIPCCALNTCYHAIQKRQLQRTMLLYDSTCFRIVQFNQISRLPGAGKGWRNGGGVKSYKRFYDIKTL